MPIWEISVNVAEGIPYETFWDKIRIVNEELNKDRHVEIMGEHKIIYSAKKWGGKTKWN